MKNLFLVIACIFIISCASEEKRLEAIKSMALVDITNLLQLPEGTKFNEETIDIAEKVSEIEGIGTTYSKNPYSFSGFARS